MTAGDFQARMQRLDALLQEVQRGPEFGAREHLRQIVQTLLDLHSAGLEKILTALGGLGGRGGLRGGRGRASLRGLGSEVQIEDGVEGELVIVVLHQDRAQGGLDRAAVGERQVAQAVHRVDPLRDRDRDADLAQLGDHAFYGGEHELAFPVVHGAIAAARRHLASHLDHCYHNSFKSIKFIERAGHHD